MTIESLIFFYALFISGLRIQLNSGLENIK